MTRHGGGGGGGGGVDGGLGKIIYRVVQNLIFLS